MTYFLFKSEPDVYSFDDLLRDKETVWDGVTNPDRREASARNEGRNEVDLLSHGR